MWGGSVKKNPMKEIEPITEEYICNLFTGNDSLVNNLFNEYFSFYYGSKKRTEFANWIAFGGVAYTVALVKNEYNSIPYTKRSFLII